MHVIRPSTFGLKKGVVAYTLVANHIPVNARIIGAHEHESHYVFDILYNNTTNVQPEVHSTDTHGTNEVNFAILHMFGYQFAPRYKDIFDTVSKSLYGFKHPSQYDDDFVLKPIRKLNPGPHRRRMGQHSANHGVVGIENDNAEHHRRETQCLRPEETRLDVPFGNTTTSSRACICWTTSIPRRFVRTFSGH